MERRHKHGDATDSSSGSSRSRSSDGSKRQERSPHHWPQRMKKKNDSRKEGEDKDEDQFFSKGSSRAGSESKERRPAGPDSSFYTTTSCEASFFPGMRKQDNEVHAYGGATRTVDFPSEMGSMSNESLKDWRDYDGQQQQQQQQLHQKQQQQRSFDEASMDGLHPQSQNKRTKKDEEEYYTGAPFDRPETLSPTLTAHSILSPRENTVAIEMGARSEGHSAGIQSPPAENAAETAAAAAAPVERMKYEAPEDPRNLIINVIVNSTSGSVTLQEIHDALQWNDQFESENGSLLDYLQGYQSIFAVSPVDDRVTLRRPLQRVKGRRTVRGQRGYDAISSRIGSISYSYVAHTFDLDVLSAIYKRRGYDTNLTYDVLHVSSLPTFDLFLFPNGVVVWWGLNRRDHWLVEDDFLTSAQSFVGEAVKERHAQESIDELFPYWCSYEMDVHYDSSTSSRREEALKRFATHLCFDHYFIPDVEPLRTQIMITVSYSLGRTAIVDFFDDATQELQKRVLSIPSDIKGPFDYLKMRREIAYAEGELHLSRMSIMEVRDSPEFLWEMPWLHDYYELIEGQNGSGQLLLWFIAKSDALLQQLANFKARRFRLFMLGSDVFLILLLIIDVIFIMTGFIQKLYFPIEE